MLCCLLSSCLVSVWETGPDIVLCATLFAALRRVPVAEKMSHVVFQEKRWFNVDNEKLRTFSDIFYFSFQPFTYRQERQNFQACWSRLIILEPQLKNLHINREVYFTYNWTIEDWDILYRIEYFYCMKSKDDDVKKYIFYEFYFVWLLYLCCVVFHFLRRKKAWIYFN